MQQRFLLQILLLAQYVSGTTMHIIRSLRVLYSGCCLWYLVLWFSSCWSGVELRVMCPVCRMLPLIRSSRVLYTGCCLWYFVLWFSSCWSGVELRVMCPVCRMLQHPANRTCPSLGAQEYYTVVAACGISCCGVQVAGLVWS